MSGNFGQTGFREEFQEPQFARSNQVRHFIGGVVAGYELGKYPGGLGALGASVANAMRELMDAGSGAGTMPDVRLGQAGIVLGYSLRLGVVSPRDSGSWILLNIAEVAP
jgi:hypothetical protein